MSAGEEIPQVVTTNAEGAGDNEAVEDAEAEYLNWLRFSESEKQRLAIEKQKFDLEKQAEEQRISHENNNHPFYRWGKWGISVLALMYIGYLSVGLGFYVLTHKFLEASWHISVVLISGVLLSIFGLFAIMLRGMFQSDRRDNAPPVTLAEVVKTAVDAIKSVKNGD